MRFTCLVFVLAVVACGGSDPYCGDGFIDIGEQCDDGNHNAGDGCSSSCAVESRCGNGRMDGGEQCDDGNTLSGDGCSTSCTTETCGNNVVDVGETCDDANAVSYDGCSATCDVEQQYTITANWVIQNIANTTSGCPGGYDTAALIAQPLDAAGNNVGTPIIDLFNCSAGTGTNAPIYEGTYNVWIAIQNTGGTMVYATSTSARIELHQNATLSTSIYTDGGYFGFAWSLVAASNNGALTCTQAGAPSVELIATLTGTSQATSDIFDCSDGAGVTAVIPVGTYTVSVSALNASSQSIGTAPELTNQPIQAPNKVTNLGTITIPISGF